MTDPHIAVRNCGDVTVVAIPSGTFELIDEFSYPSAVVKALEDEFRQAVAAASGGIVIDMRDTKYLNHASVNLLFKLARTLVDRKFSRAICCSAEVKSVLDLCRLDRPRPHP